MLEWVFGEVVQDYPQTPFGIENLRHRVVIRQGPEEIPDLFAVGNGRAGRDCTGNRRSITTDCQDSRGRPPLKQMYKKSQLL